MNKRKLRSMLIDSNIRMHFEKFNLINVKYTDKAYAQLKEMDETDFFNCFSEAECNEDWCGYFTLCLEEFWFTIIQLPEQPNEKVGCYSIWFQTYREVLEERRAEIEVEAHLLSGEIEIE